MCVPRTKKTNDGGLFPVEPSTFIREIPKDMVEEQTLYSADHGYGGDAGPRRRWDDDDDDGTTTYGYGGSRYTGGGSSRGGSSSGFGRSGGGGRGKPGGMIYKTTWRR